MDAARWINTDELTEAVFALEMVLEQAQRISQYPYRWKWTVIALHNALQGFMVCALRGTNNLRILTTKAAQKWLKAYERHAPLPRERLAAPLCLFERLKSDQMIMYTTSRKLDTTSQQDRSVRKLHKLRNEFTHFLPKDWSVEVSGLSRIGLDCIEVIRFLAFEAGNILWTSRDPLRRRCLTAVQDLASVFREMNAPWED